MITAEKTVMRAGVYVFGQFPELGRVLEPRLSHLASIIPVSTVEEVASARHCGVLLLDADTANASVPAVQRRLASGNQVVLTVIGTNAASLQQQSSVLNLGAFSYLPKAAPAEQWLSVVETAAKIAIEQQNDEQQTIERLQVLKGLAQRERQLLKLVTSGVTNREIAAELDVGKRTVDRWRANLLIKFDVGSAIELSSAVADAEIYRQQGGWLPRLATRLTRQRLATE